MSGSVATRVEANILLVRDMDTSRGPGLLENLSRMRVVGVVGEMGYVGGEGSADVSGGQQRRLHALRPDD